MKKKILTAILMMIASLALSTSAFALTEGDWEFQLLDNEAKITGYLGTDEDIVVPDTLYGAKVTSIALDYYKDFKNATTVTFPSSVKSIPDCGWGEKLESVYLPDGVETLQWNAFKGCSSLSNVQLPSTLKTIEPCAFANCTSITSINFPASLQSIGMGAFEYSGITSLVLPAIEYNDKNTFRCCDNLTSVVLSEGITAVQPGMFANCKALTDVTIPSTVTELRGGAFEGCISLEKIILPTSLKLLDGGVFRNTRLKELVVPYGTEIVGHYSDYSVFGDNPSLKSVYIPDTVKTMSQWNLNGSPNAIIYCSQDSYTAQKCKEWQFSYLTDKSVNSGITVLYNGTRISFHTYDQNPELIQSRTLVPLRAIFEAMDAEVEWDQATKTATSTRNGVTVSITIGANEMYKNGEAIAVDVPAQILNNRTMIPVRVIAEAFGADVEWNASGRTVLINE